LQEWSIINKVNKQHFERPRTRWGSSEERYTKQNSKRVDTYTGEALNGGQRRLEKALS
jgi:hypothetical protein